MNVDEQKPILIKIKFDRRFWVEYYKFGWNIIKKAAYFIVRLNILVCWAIAFKGTYEEMGGKDLGI